MLDKKTIDGLVGQIDGVIVVLERQVIFGRTENQTAALERLQYARLLLFGERIDRIEQLEQEAKEARARPKPEPRRKKRTP